MMENCENVNSPTDIIHEQVQIIDYEYSLI